MITKKSQSKSRQSMAQVRPPAAVALKVGWQQSAGAYVGRALVGAIVEDKEMLAPRQGVEPLCQVSLQCRARRPATHTCGCKPLHRPGEPALQ